MQSNAKSQTKVAAGATFVSSKTANFIAVRQCLGVDVSKDKLDVCFLEMDANRNCRVKAQTVFGNTRTGWGAILTYLKKFRKADLPFSVVMEATGVYYEGLAYFLKTNNIDRSVVLPNKSRNYARSLNIKSKNDKIEAKTLAQMGLEQNLRLWHGMNANLLKIKRLLREREALMAQLTVLKNQSHATQHGHAPDKKTLARFVAHQKFILKQVKDIEAQVSQARKSDTELDAKVTKICTIKGVASLTALTVIAEANGFELIENKAQLVSYVGYDVVENQSGTSLKGKTKISKKGNAHIRRALYFPAMSAVSHDPKFKVIHERITEKNPKIKMIGYVAVQRKLLVLIYTLFKNNTEYDPNYGQNTEAKTDEQPIPNQQNRQS
jgi:transposase